MLELVRQLPDRERVAIQRVFTGEHLSEVGRATGRSAEMVRKWELSGLRILRGELGLGPKRPRSTAPPLDARERFDAALAAGGCTVTELRELTGYTRMGVLTRLKRLGAVQSGAVLRNGRTIPLWVLPPKAA